jgi:hypothetical protein
MAIEHGTVKGHARHLLLKEKPCAKCTKAVYWANRSTREYLLEKKKLQSFRTIKD